MNSFYRTSVSQMDRSRYPLNKSPLTPITEEDEIPEGGDETQREETKLDLDKHLEYVAVCCDSQWHRGRILANKDVVPGDDLDAAAADQVEKTYSVLLVDAGRVVRNVRSWDIRPLPSNFRDVSIPVCKLTFPEISQFKDQKPMEELARVLNLQDYT